MNKSTIAAAFVFGVLWAPTFAAEPLQPGYKVDERIQLFFREWLVSGPRVDKPRESHYLVCTYSARPVVMVYTREINPPVIRLIRKLNEAVAAHQQERLGSYAVLLGEGQDREKELLALAEKGKIEHMHLAMAVPNERFQAKFGVEAETTVVLATDKWQVKASFAFRKGELKDKDIEQILADVPIILPKKN